MKALERLKREYHRMWAKLGYKKPLWDLPVRPDRRGSGHLEYHDERWSWVMYERGGFDYGYEIGSDAQMVEWLALNLTSGLARREEEDADACPGTPGTRATQPGSRITRQIELMEKLNLELSRRLAAEQQRR